MPRSLLVLTWLFVCAPSAATALVIEFSGVVRAVVDPAARLDDSVDVGALLTGRYIVDPTPSGNPGEVGPARLLFTLGSYAFDVSHDPHTIDLIDDLPVGPAQIDRWQPAAFVAAQLEPAIAPEPDGAGFSAQIQFTDFSHTLITGLETEPFVVLDAAPWSDTRLFFTSLVALAEGGTGLGNLQWEVEIDSWQAVPEPASAALLALGLAALARARPRRS